MESDYDKNIARVKEIVARLESDEAVSLEEYKRLAAEAKALLEECRSQLTKIEEETVALLSPNA
ncbi:MAG: exodeoxyribonuclease VII small subunit [Paludibacteraceae bacterium]|nr:exodeoxyribonuclease VII small subunit [Paludibacteraceae bacterium]